MHFLIETISQVEWQQVVMWLIGGTLIFLAIKKDMEPALLLPMGFGAILVNIPGSAVIADDGILSSLFKVGIEASEAMPILLFIGIGAMIDFGPLLSNPKLFILGGSAQLGIFLTLILAALIGFSLPNAAAIAIIGAADRAHLHTRGHQAGVRLRRADHGGRLFVYGAGAHRSARRGEALHHEKGTSDQNALQRETGE